MLSQRCESTCVSRKYWKRTGKVGVSRKAKMKEEFPEFQKDVSELGISQSRISRVSRVLTSLTAWEARALPLGDTRIRFRIIP